MSLAWPFGLFQPSAPPTVYCWLEALPTPITPVVEDVTLWLWSSAHAQVYSATLSMPNDDRLTEALVASLSLLVHQLHEKPPLLKAATRWVWLVPASVDQTMPLAKGLMPEEQLLALQAQLEERWVFQNDLPAIAYQQGQDETTSFDKPLVAALGQQSVWVLNEVAKQIGFSNPLVVWQAPVLWQGIHTATKNVGTGVWLGRFQFVEMGGALDTRFWRCAGHPYPRSGESLEKAIASYCQPNPHWLLNQHPEISNGPLLAALKDNNPRLLESAVETDAEVLDPTGNEWIQWVQQAVATHPEVVMRWAFHIPTLIRNSLNAQIVKQPFCWEKILGWSAVGMLILVLLTGLALAVNTQQLNDKTLVIQKQQRLLEQAVARHHRQLNNRVIVTLAKAEHPTDSHAYTWQGPNGLQPPSTRSLTPREQR